MIDWFVLVLFVIGLVEFEQNLTLAVAAGIDLRVGDIAAEDRIGDGTRSAYGYAQIGAKQILVDAFSGPEVKEFVFDDVAAGTAAKLLTMEIGKRLAV